jgi:aspartate carbamoyltransferase catalytic subunit
MHVEQSSVKKGEGLIDTARTINAMGPDVFVLRHAEGRRRGEVAAVMDCAVINGGDGATSIRRRPCSTR